MVSKKIIGIKFWGFMNNNIKINNGFHLGVYGIILKDCSILLIKKGRGGKFEYGEHPKQVLAREILEETGIKIYVSNLFDNYSTVVEQFIDDNIQNRLHHLGMIYIILSYDDKALINEMNIEDSLGAKWYKLANLTKDMLSPFVYKAINDINKLL